MKPCSAYCRPDEGVHVWLSWAPHDVETMNRRWRGALRLILSKSGNACLPDGTEVQIVGLEPAIEHDETSPDPEHWPHPTLVTVAADWRPAEVST